jgi:hypothetical protein
MGIFDFWKKKEVKITEYDREIHGKEEGPAETLVPIEISNNCKILEADLQECVQKKKGLYGCDKVLIKYKECIDRDMHSYSVEDDARDLEKARQMMAKKK